jgi:hypothetical protein
MVVKHKAQKFQQRNGEKVLFRYEGVAYSLGTDEYDNPLPGYNMRLVLQTHPVVKTTPCGAWIGVFGFNEDKRFVRLTAKKKYACVTEHEALESLKARKLRQIQILSAQLEKAENVLALCNMKLEELAGQE